MKIPAAWRPGNLTAKKKALLWGVGVLVVSTLLMGFWWNGSGTDVPPDNSSSSESSSLQESSASDSSDSDDSSSGSGLSQSSGQEDSSAHSSDSSSVSSSDSQSSSSSSSSSSSASSEESSSSSSSKPDSGTSSNPESTPDPAPEPTPPESNPSPAPDPSVRGKYVVGYYPYYARNSGFTPLKLAASKLTHINYAFADISSQHKLVMANPTTDLKNFEDLRQLKKRNSQLKTLISVGGWDYSKNFSNAAATAASRETFAQSCVDFIIAHGFDGVDMDWEFPVSGGLPGNSNRPEDKQNFTKLLQAIRGKLDQQSKIDGRPYYLTIAGAAGSGFLNKIDPASVATLVDYIFIMGYDMHGPWDSYADLNAPLYTPSEDSPQYKLSVNDAVRAYLNRGISASKLVLGMPFYGYKYTVQSGGGLYSPFTSASSVGYDKIVSTYLGSSEYEQLFHWEAMVPYLSSGSSFISYEDADSIAEKTRYAKSMGLAGVGAWELSHDKNAVLLSSAYHALYS